MAEVMFPNDDPRRNLEKSIRWQCEAGSPAGSDQWSELFIKPAEPNTRRQCSHSDREVKPAKGRPFLIP